MVFQWVAEILAQLEAQGNNGAWLGKEKDLRTTGTIAGWSPRYRKTFLDRLAGKFY